MGTSLEHAPKLGDQLSGLIRETEGRTEGSRNRKRPYAVETPLAGWRVEIQQDPSCPTDKRFLRLGDSVTGWIVRKLDKYRFAAISLTDFGRFPPPSPETELLVKSLHEVAQFAVAPASMKPPIKAGVVISEVLNSVVRKQSPNWFFLYSAFRFTDDLEANRARTSFTTDFLQSLRGAIPASVRADDPVGRSCGRLLASGMIERLRAAARALVDATTDWDLAKLEVPLLPRGHSPVDAGVGTTDPPQIDQRSAIRVDAHLRQKVSMSDFQRERLSAILKDHDIILADGVKLTLEGFSGMDWTTATLVRPYERQHGAREEFGDQCFEDQGVRSIETAIKMEKATQGHQLLVNEMARLLGARGIESSENTFIDLHGRIADTSVIFEMKTVTPSNCNGQIRKAISQLYEYRYIHSMPDAALCIVLDHFPYDEWMLAYLRDDRGIDLCWRAVGGFEYQYKIAPFLDVFAQQARRNRAEQ